MILSDVSLAERFARGTALVWQALKRATQPASIDVRLGDSVRVYRRFVPGYVIDLRDPNDPTEYIALGRDGYELPPGGFALAATRERVNVPADLCAFLAGRSGVARIGLQIEAAGLLDPGYHGHPTLELFNQAPYPIRLYAGMPIGQVYFVQMTEAAERPYGHRDRMSKYQADREPTRSLMYQEA